MDIDTDNPEPKLSKEMEQFKLTIKATSDHELFLLAKQCIWGAIFLKKTYTDLPVKRDLVEKECVARDKKHMFADAKKAILGK